MNGASGPAIVTVSLETDPPRATTIRCPQCCQPIQYESDSSAAVLCARCGSSLRICDATAGTALQPLRMLGKFQLQEKVGFGAFGAVWRARDTELERVVALKIPHGGLMTTAAELERFHREARAAAQLRHPGIVPVHEVMTLDGLPALVSDFIQGVTLKDYLEGRKLSFREAATMTADLAEALDYAHNLGLVHRDVKPGNIMVENPPRDPGPQQALDTLAGVGRPMIMDFGLALRDDAEITMTVDGQIIGTPAYMSPEQAAGRGHQVDRRSDVYSLGVVLYQMLTGELPFRGAQQMILHQVLHEEPRPLRKLNDQVPRDLETICLKALGKSSKHRYATARDMADDLRRHLTGMPILARPAGVLEHTVKWVQRRPAAATALAAGATAVVVLAAATVLLKAANADLVQANQAEITAKRQAEANFDEAERQRQLFEESFRQARAAVDDFIRASEGELYNKPGLEEARRKAFEIATKYHEEFIKQRGDDPTVQRELAHAYEHLGNLVGPTEPEKAIALHEKALQIREKLSLATPHNADLQADCASSYHNLGVRAAARSQSETALNCYDKAVKILARLVQDHPTQRKFQVNLGKAYDNIGTVHHKTKNSAKAIAYYQKAIQIQERLRQNDPVNAELQRGLAQTFNNLSILQGETSQFADAYVSFAKTEKLYAELTKAFADNFEYLKGRAMACRGMGLALAKQDRREEAVAAFQQAIHHQRAALGMAPAKGRHADQYRVYLRTHCRLLADVLRDLGRPTDAVTAWLDLRALVGGQPEQLYQAAEGLALCLPLIGNGAENLTASEKDQRQKIIDSVLETLHMAVAAGYSDGANLKANAAFAPIRARPEFQKLLAQLQ